MARASGSYPEGRRFDPYSRYQLWAFSSAGRASALQAGCHRFEPYNAHHYHQRCLLPLMAKILFCIRRSFRACGPVVQLVRMPACHAGGRRFEPVPDRHFLLKIIDLVGVVKWLRPRVVAPVYVSSNLTIHPIRNFSIQLYMTKGYRQAVRQWILILIMRRFESYYPRQFQIVSRFVGKLSY